MNKKYVIVSIHPDKDEEYDNNSYFLYYVKLFNKVKIIRHTNRIGARFFIIYAKDRKR